VHALFPITELISKQLKMKYIRKQRRSNAGGPHSVKYKPSVQQVCNSPSNPSQRAWSRQSTASLCILRSRPSVCAPCACRVSPHCPSCRLRQQPTALNRIEASRTTSAKTTSNVLLVRPVVGSASILCFGALPWQLSALWCLVMRTEA